MKCKYSIEGKLVTTEDLIVKFLEAGGMDTTLDPSAAIYSSDDIQTSTINSIKKLQVSKVPETHIPLKELITKPNKNLFDTLGSSLWKEAERLVPEYIQENWIKEFVVSNKDIKIPDELLDNDVLEVEVDKDRFDSLIRMADLEDIEHNTIKYTQFLAEEKIREDEKFQKVSYLFHNILSDVLDDTKSISFDQSFHNHFSKPLEELQDIFGENTEENIDRWKTSIQRIISEIATTVRNIGRPISNMNLISHPSSKLQIGGHIDLVAIDADGKPHVFEITVSKDEYSKWSDAKKATIDWTLTMQRQLLGQTTDISESQLHIIPIDLKSLQDPNQLRLGKFEQRSHAEGSGTGSKGRLSLVAEKLLPRRIFSKFSLAKFNSLQQTLKAALSADYQIKTEFEDNDVDLIMKSAERRFNQTGVWSRYNKYDNIDGLTEEWIEVTPENDSKEARDKAKAEFRSKIVRYVEFVKEQEHRGVALVKDAFISAIKTNQNLKTSKFSAKKDEVLNRLLEGYLNDSWEVLSIPEAESAGLFVMRNKDDNEISIFNISTTQAYATFQPDRSKGYLHGDLDAIKAMIFLNEFKDTIMPNETFKLGQIITFNPRNGESYYKTSHEIYKMFEERMYNAGLNNEIKIQTTDLVGVEDLALKNFFTAMTNYDGRYKDEITRITDVFENKHLHEIDKELLIQARKELLEKFPTYINKTVNPEINFDDRIEVILALLQVAILTKEGVDPAGDFQHLTMYSLQAADFRSLLNAIYTQDVVEYDKTGKKVQWLIGGLAWTNPEYVQSKDLRQINSLISTGNSSIRERMVHMNEKTRGHSVKFFEAAEYNTFQRMTLGNSQDLHRSLFLTDPDGNITADFQTKNPYISDVDNALEAYEKEYLQELLLIINQYKYGIADVEIDKLDASKLDSLMKNATLKRAIEDGDYFKMPLIRKSGVGKYKDAFQSHGDKWRLLSMAKDKFDSFLDQRELSEQDVENIEAEQLGFFEMYDVYAKQDADTRGKMIEERGVNYFELNLDTIAHRVAFSKIRKQTFDLILPTVNSYIWWIKLMGGKQNVDVSKQLKYITNQIKLAVFDEPLINDEQKSLAAGLSFARQLTTTMMLAFRPVLLAKEMTIGVLKNFSAAALGINEEFTAKEMTKAYEKLLSIDNKFTDEFNLIDRLNQFYGMANMDTATIPGKLQTDRWGVTKGLGNYMYMTSTVGDYYNRMAVLLSKMIKDGSYDAHSMKGGKMIYDPTKDERYSYYLANREKHKDVKGNYIPKKGDVKYNTQRNNYILALNQMNKEGIALGSKRLTEKDLIKKAYSHKERDSIKSYSDLMYGAYDKDWQAQIGHTLYGIAFMQFLTFWPNKMRFYFGKPISADESPQGKVTQDYVMKDGQKVLLWYASKELEDGSFERSITEENTGDPVLKWEGTPQEGVFVSLAYTAQDLVRGNWDKIKDNKLRRNRALFAIADGFLIGMLVWLINQMIKAASEDLGRDSIAGELLHFSDVTGRKVINEYDIWDNTFGSIRTEPLALAKSLDMANGLIKTISGDKELRSLAAQSFGALEFLKD